MNIEVSNLSKKYKDVEALKNINLSITSPSMIGLVGPNGAGKSTLMKILVTQLKQTKGEIKVDGIKLEQCEKSFRGRLGYLPQDFGLFDEMTVYGYLDYMYCIKGLSNSKNVKKGVIESCMEDVDISAFGKKKIRTLSGGQKQRVGIAQALLNDPQIFIVDEPTVGLDPEERVRFRNFFSRKAANKLILLSTHIIEDIQSICNRLIVMDKGNIKFDGKPHELIKLAEGHTGIVSISSEDASEKSYHIEQNYNITNRVMSENGIDYKIVGEELPAYAKVSEPTLEDAYVYCMNRRGVTCR